MRNRNGIFWGIFLLLSAVILVASQMHILTYSFGFWTIIATIILVAVLIKSLIYFMVPGTVFSLAFLAILYAKPLGITMLSPWTILGAALLVSIGLSLILRPFLAKHHPWMNFHKEYSYGHHGKFANFDYDSDSDVKTVDSTDVEVDVKMGNSIRYVKSEDFTTADINVTMGDAKVYFENVEIKDSATINVRVSLGNVSLFVPREWNVVKELNNSMGNISEFGHPKVNSASPTVYITGNASMANIKITYI